MFRKILNQTAYNFYAAANIVDKRDSSIILTLCRVEIQIYAFEPQIFCWIYNIWGLLELVGPCSMIIQVPQEAQQFY
jgi:hypothetical protein